MQNKIKNLIFSIKNKPYILSGLFLILIYIILRLFFFESDPIYRLMVLFGNSYLLLAESLANTLLHWTGSMVTIENHMVVINNVQLDGFVPEIRLRKWMILFLALIFITKAKIRKKILFSFLLIMVHFIVLSVYTASGALLSSGKDPVYSYLSIPITLGLLVLVTLIFYWFKKHKKPILDNLSKLKINPKIFENENKVFGVLYVYLILSSFFFEFFEFKPWIDFLFVSSQKILSIIGYDAVVEPFRLVGSNGSVAMIKGCLGFQTMFLFAVLIFLTGSKNKCKWIYIIAGVVFLNFVNIMRFVFLFIHLQNHGDYLLSIEVHDLYNYVTYFLVFVLWIIWFEKFADSPEKVMKND